MKLIETARRDGVYDGLFSSSPARPLTDLEWKKIEKCLPCVFTERKGTIETIPQPSDEVLFGEPFPEFSIENFKTEMGMLEPEKEEDIVGLPCMMCVVCLERVPTKFDYLVLFEIRTLRISTGKELSAWIVVSSNNDKALTNSISALVEKFTARMNGKERWGQESTKISVMIGNPIARTHRIRKVIYIRPKNEISKSDRGLSGRPIVWSHRFEVRGCWVSIPGRMGKNREGDYCVPDYTWRVHHTKGPEHLPLIKKTRIFETRPE